MGGNGSFSTMVSNLLSSLTPQEHLCMKSWRENEAYRQRTCDSNLSHALRTSARVYKDSIYATKARHPHENVNCRPILSLATQSQLLKQAAKDNPLYLPTQNTQNSADKSYVPSSSHSITTNKPNLPATRNPISICSATYTSP